MKMGSPEDADMRPPTGVAPFGGPLIATNLSEQERISISATPKPYGTLKRKGKCPALT
jgi:hypothetical protein